MLIKINEEEVLKGEKEKKDLKSFMFFNECSFLYRKEHTIIVKLK